MNTASKFRQNESGNKHLWGFFALAYGLTWLFWIPVALSGQNANTTSWLIPTMLGGFGPSVAGTIMVYRIGGKVERRTFWKRVIDFKRISAGGYLFIFVIFPVLFMINLALNKLFGYPLPEFETLTQIAANPLILIGMLVSGIITGPLSEELGWRGFALDQLQTQASPLASSLILAFFWAGWHLPLFFMNGTTQSEWGVGTLSFWLFIVATFPLSFIFTKVYNDNQQSILAVVLTHFMYNFTFSLCYPFSPIFYLFQVILLFSVAIGLILLTKPD